MRRFGIVFAREFRETLRSRPFIIISVFLGLLLAAAAVGGLLLSAGSGGDAQGSVDYTQNGAAAPGEMNVTYLYSVAVEDRAGGDTLERLREQLPYIRFEEKTFDGQTAENMVRGGEYDACVVLSDPVSFEIYEQPDLYGDSLGDELSDALTLMARVDALAALGVDSGQAHTALDSDPVWYTVHSVGGSGMGRYIMGYVMVLLMFLVIGLYGQMVATRVAAEKGSRTMEVLAAAVSPVELLCGKVLGVGAAGLAQILVFLLGGGMIVRGIIGSSPMLSVVAGQLLDITAADGVCLVLYFLLGFGLYAFIFGALGSMVSQLEDLSGLASMPLYLFMAGYLIAIMGASGAQSGVLVKIGSFVPFWSPVVMFSRMSVEQVPVWQLALSLLLLALSAAGAAWLSARIYRTGMLRYGKPPKLKEIINAARTGRR